jgi:hypothetical protein
MNENRTERLTKKQKEANNFAWYKKKIDELDSSFEYFSLGNAEEEYNRMKINYNLFNNIIDPKDFEHVTKPFGQDYEGKLPAKLVNKDICSGPIKVVLGMEMKRAFPYSVLATNSEATTRKEQEHFDRVKQYVEEQIMGPIKAEQERAILEQTQGQQINEQQKQELQQKMEQEMQAQTPEQIKKYMELKHQDPAEVLGTELLNYSILNLDVKRKLNLALKHGLLAAKSVVYVGIFNGEPVLWNVDNLRYNSSNTPGTEFGEDEDWCTAEYFFSPNKVVQLFGSEMSNTQIDSLYDNNTNTSFLHDNVEKWLADNNSPNKYKQEENTKTVRVLHGVWKGLREVNFLKYLDENEEEQTLVVDENYKINKDQGDIEMTTEWLLECYETWKIGKDIYLRMQPVQGQFKDLDNLNYCKLPYYSVKYDATNSVATSLMDRLKPYQYAYNIICYRLENLIATDKGKKVLMNVNSIPSSAGMDITKWQYFMESSPYMWYEPNEEGSGYQDANTIAKVIDLSLASDINKYMEIAEAIRLQAGRSVGIPDSVLGQIGANEAVSNTSKSMEQSSHILEPYFNTHAVFKKNVLLGLLEATKVAYTGSKKKKLTYVLDDMSKRLLDIDLGLLDSSTLGLFISDSTKAEETKETIKQLAHASLQNQKIELSDLLSVLRQESIADAEAVLKVAENKRKESEQQSQQSQQEHEKELEAKKAEEKQKDRDHEIRLAVTKEEEKRKTVEIQASLMGASFNPETDRDNDGINDYIELAKNGLDAEIKRGKLDLERDALEHKKQESFGKLQNESLKIDAMKQKNNIKK